MNTVFPIHELKQGDIIILFNKTSLTCIDSRLCEKDGRKIFIHEIESNIYKVVRKKCLKAQRNSYKESLMTINNWRKESRILIAYQIKLKEKMRLNT